MHDKLKLKAAGLLDKSGGDLQHLISDNATMQIIRWTDGGFGMAVRSLVFEGKRGGCRGLLLFYPWHFAFASTATSAAKSIALIRRISAGH